MFAKVLKLYITVFLDCLNTFLEIMPLLCETLNTNPQLLTQFSIKMILPSCMPDQTLARINWNIWDCFSSCPCPSLSLPCCCCHRPPPLSLSPLHTPSPTPTLPLPSFLSLLPNLSPLCCPWPLPSRLWIHCFKPEYSIYVTFWCISYCNICKEVCAFLKTIRTNSTTQRISSKSL